MLPGAYTLSALKYKDKLNVRHGDLTSTHRAHEVQGRSWNGPVHVRERWRHQIRNERGSQATTEDGVRLKRIVKHWLDAPSCIQDLWWHMGAELSRRRCYVDNMGPSTPGGVLRSDSVELKACSSQALVGLACGRSRPDGVCTTSGRRTLRRYHHARDWKRTDSGAAGRFISKSRTPFTFLKRQYHQPANEYLTRKCAIHR